MFSPAAHAHNSPYFQSSKFSMQAAKNQVNVSSSSISNVYKRDRSSSNNAMRPPMPTYSATVAIASPKGGTHRQRQTTTQLPRNHETFEGVSHQQ